MKKTKPAFRLTLILLLLIGLNFLSARYFVRLDFTSDKIYTLSKATKDLLNNLPENVRITAYFTKELPPDIQNMRKDFRDLLVEYYQRSKGKLVFEFVDPSASTLDEEAATRAGIQPLVANIREKDQMKQQKVYLGLVVECDGQTDVIPFITPGAGMEFALSTSIRKVSTKDKMHLAFTTGKGEPGPEACPQLMQNLQVLYLTDQIRLSDSSLNPAEIPTLVVGGPSDSLAASEIQALERYHASGGNLLIALNPVQGDFNSMSLQFRPTGIESWLRSKGLVIQEEAVIDASCSNIGITQQQGGFNFTSQIPFPWFPELRTFDKHPVTAGLESLVLPFVSPVTTISNPEYHFTPLLKSSDKSGSMKLPASLDINHQWEESEFTKNALVLGGLLEPAGTGSKKGKIFLITDADFYVNGQGQDAHEVQPDNINLMMNAIDFLNDESGLMELRTKEVTSRPLQEMEENQKTLIKYANFLLPIILALGFGIYRYQRNRMIRAQRMEKTTIVTK